MSGQIIVIQEESQVKDVLKNALLEIEQEKAQENDSYKLLRRTDAAKLLGVSQSKITRLIKKGLLQLSADGVYVTKSSINAYVQKQSE